ncbi:T9SS type A sorting domain-containing protein [Marivirga harenae]|uniref:T9SS type A sorting domain-containing protein n=1 Tax=Marivirga harenae TaxID=2010992 RepID=UPI0026E04E3E|nr:T9SS type A sorting domain-containing protein [Marivirga harenae]WKV13141.1 T9SS type A sorting domain-containing protein [Marivirga harenae]|tara:strand:- start:287663 stop:288151 length:489 start_codon:yes stop_codon:yes gene_type:complete
MSSKKTYYLLIFIFCAFCISKVRAQNLFASTGNNVSGSGGSVSYSIGQTIANINKAEAGSVSQGIQQSYKITTLNTKNDKTRDFSLEVFPNPTRNTLNLRIDNIGFENLSFELFNIEGKILDKGLIRKSNTSINMNERESNTYLLRLTHKDEVVEIFRIIKL